MVGYTSFIKKAKLSDDEVLVTQWNKLLQGQEILDGSKYTTSSKARALFIENGSTIDDFTPKADGYHFYWNKDDNRIYLIKDDDPNTAVFPENSSVRNAIMPLSANYLTFTAEQAGSTIKFNPKSGTWQYKIGTNDWENGDSSTTITLENQGDKVMLRGTNCTTHYSNLNYFIMTGKVAASGSVTSLTDGVGIDSNIMLSNACYFFMFKGCTSLTTAPELPATKLTESCYISMFEGCASLITAPELPAISLAQECYNYMFSGCSSLITAPELPATTLTESCYKQMFNNCTSLTTAPELPATTLAKNCYEKMFFNCTSLKVSVSTGSNKIFTCPSSIPTDAVKEMFYSCAIGEELYVTPSSGFTYYWN